MPIPVSRGRLPAPVQSAAVRSDEGSNSRRSEDETTAAEPSVASPGSLRADAGRFRAVHGRGILAHHGGNGGNCQISISRLEAEPNFEASVQASGRLEGQPVRWSGRFNAGHIGDFCRVTRSAMPCTEEAGGEPLDGTRRSDVHAHRLRGVIP